MALKVVVEGYMAAPMVKDKLRNSERPCRRFWTTVQALKWPATSTKDIGRVGEWTGPVNLNERGGALELPGSHLTASHIHPQLPGDSSRRRSGHSMKERFTRNDGQWRAPRPVSSIIHGSDPIVKPLQQAHSSQEPLCSAPWRGP